MKRVCFLGNSHLAAFKQATDDLRARNLLAGHEIVYFAAPADWIGQCAVDNGQVLPVNAAMERDFMLTSGGRKTLGIAEYDDIYITGGVSPRSVAQYISWPPLRPVGRALIRRIIDASLNGFFSTLPERIARAGGRVHWVSAPFLAETYPYAEHLRAALDADASGAERARLHALRAAIDEELARFPTVFASVIDPPPDTRDGSGCFTRAEYSRDVAMFENMAHLVAKGPDYLHMNRDYGRAAIAHVLGLDLDSAP